MSNVIDAVRHAYEMDPADHAPFVHVFSRGAAADAALAEDEDILSFTISPTPPAVSAGMSISAEAGKEPRLEDAAVGFWPRLDPAANVDTLFDGPGVDLGIEITITTSLGRVIQRTGTIRVRQR